MKQILLWLGIFAFPALLAIVVLIGVKWNVITNLMEAKTSFSIAIEALKKGAAIYRVNGWRKIGSEVRTSNGKTKTVYGTFDKDGDVDGSIIVNQEDIFADDWVIIWPNKEEK
jgi:hypothetical protein